MDARKFATETILMGQWAYKNIHHKNVRVRELSGRQLQEALNKLLAIVDTGNPCKTWFCGYVQERMADFHLNRPEAYAPFLYGMLFKFVVTSETNTDWPTFEQVAEKMEQPFAQLVVHRGGKP